MAPRRFRRALARSLMGAAAWLGACGAARADVGSYLGKQVASVRLMIEGTETDDSVLRQIIATAPGQPLSMVQVRETVAHLFSLGRFEGVSVDATLEDGRVALRYELVPIHPVSRIRFMLPPGTHGIDEGGLHRAVVDRYGTTPPLSRVADMTRILADALRERGYLRPAITPRPEIEHAPERATLVFTIDPGPRTTIGTIEVLGPATERAEIRAQLGLSPGAPYQSEALNARIERFTEERRRRGYYEAKIVPAVTLADDDRVANITLTVTPGPRVRVVFNGDPLPSDRRAELVPVEREGSVDEDLLEDSSNRIEEFLRAQGYRDAKAPHKRETANGELVITFAIARGQQFRVATFEISGNASVPLSEFAPALRLRDGQPFSASRLDADVQLIEELYHRRGFASAKVQSAVDTVTTTPPPAQVPVAVRAVINEGVRTTVDGVTFSGNQNVGEEALRRRLALQPGTPYVPGQLAVDRDAILLAYQDLGYESATVEARPDFSDDGTHVQIGYVVREGPQVFVDHVLIVGNVRTSSETIQRELRLKPGDPFSLNAINDSQRRLTALGLFRRARITELRHGGETLRDLLVTIEEAPATTLGYGGGLEGRLRVVGNSTDNNVDETFEVAPRAFFEVGRRNVFGKNRSLTFYSSLSLHPPREDGTSITEYRVVGTFREPRVFDTAADAFINTIFEQQTRSSFNFARQSFSADIARRLTREISVTGTYQLQRTRVFDERLSPEDQRLIDKAFPQFRLSSFSGAIIHDTRDDAVDPSRGGYASATGQLAARAIGSEIGFVKTVITAQAFRIVPRTNRVVFATNARLGLASAFPRGVIDSTGELELTRSLPQSERFYAGGDTTVRGFALDRVGSRHVPALPTDTLDENLLPIGGNGLIIVNAELRTPVTRALGVVGFLDAGNVFAGVRNIDVTDLRGAVGGGVRYRSPFGPIRFDIGFKVDRQPGEGPSAWFVSFGQAF
jgi:outer membrane protein insertion porin family